MILDILLLVAWLSSNHLHLGTNTLGNLRPLLLGRLLSPTLRNSSLQREVPLFKELFYGVILQHTLDYLVTDAFTDALLGAEFTSLCLAHEGQPKNHRTTHQDVERVYGNFASPQIR